ncbi:hypothetical protein NLN82_25900 [Citrobacter portucalensis]|uniref:hypothetical protein n=1 Tax=Citrobacter portucalensis TaxID=1639133 RepID=UPI00226B4E20|nr:hypothetical protein [Citrobacter portucalensis]MCX9039441.1 hypothetical protein [Citrobacter portucalensis]
MKSEANNIPGSKYANASEALAHLAHEFSNFNTKPYSDAFEASPDMLTPLLNALFERLYQHGLMLNQSFLSSGSGADYNHFSILTTFFHIPTNTKCESISLAPSLDQDKSFVIPEEFKLDFHRRYALYGVLGVTDENTPERYNL